jgi:haloacetate dehalogenase
LLALWEAKCVVGQLYDVLASWREKATHVQGRPLECGHAPQEEMPVQTAAALFEFLQ